MKKILYLSIALIGFAICPNNAVKAQQGVAINGTGASADASAALDVAFNNMGVLLPRMSSSNRDAITNPATGLTIFNTDCNVYNYNSGTPLSPVWTTLDASNVLTASVIITSNPAGTVCGSATFTATPASGITSATYQWQVNGSNGPGSSTGSTYTYTPSNGDLVTCILSSSQNCVTGSPATSNTITVSASSVPANPGTISGSTTVCPPSTGNVYSVSAVSGATYYNWVVPNGASITSGVGSNSITVSFTSLLSSTISVNASNDCGASSSSALVLGCCTPPPSTPGAVTGGSGGTGGSSSAYSISAVGGATNYTWSDNGTGTISSGQGTDAVTVTFGADTGETISVTAGNGCGSSIPASKHVSICSPSTHGSISFSYNGGQQTWQVPCADTVQIQCWGAGQQNGNSIGGFAQGTLSVSPGQILYIFVGGSGNNGGYNGGGQGYNNSYTGGGMTDVSTSSSNTASNWVIVAGGGGGYGGGGYSGGAGGNSYTSGGSPCSGGSISTYGGQGYGGGYGNSPFGGSITSGGCYGGSGNYFCCSSSYSGGGGGGGLNSGGTGGYDGSYNSVYSVETGTMGQGGAWGGYNYPGCSNEPGGGGGFYGGGGTEPGNCTTGAGGGGSSWTSPSMTNVSFYGYAQSGYCYYNGNQYSYNGYNGYVTLKW